MFSTNVSYLINKHYQTQVKYDKLAISSHAYLGLVVPKYYFIWYWNINNNMKQGVLYWYLWTLTLYNPNLTSHTISLRTGADTSLLNDAQ